MMDKFFVLMSALLLCVSAQATPTIQQWTSSNGAHVLFVEAPDLPMVDIRLVFDAGSARDGNLPGIALLTNGLLSEGAGDWNSDQISERIENVGARLSTTSLRDMSIVSLRSLTEKKALATALETLSKVVTAPVFDQTAFERDLATMKVNLRQEQQSPASIAKKAFYKAMYGDHPYAHPSNGTRDALEKITRKDVLNFYHQYFVAKNLSVVIVGAVDQNQAKKMVEQILSQLPSGEHAPKLPPVNVPAKGQRITIDFPSLQAHLFLGMPVLSRDDPDYFPLYVGNHMLGGSGLVSQLAVEVREKRGLAYSTYSYFSPMREKGPFMMGLQTKNAQVKEAEAVVRQTLKDFLQNGPSDEALLHSKQNITGGFPLKISSNKKIVEHLAMLAFYGMPLDFLDRYVDKVNAVTTEQIKDAFNRRIKTDAFSTIVVGPQTAH